MDGTKSSSKWFIGVSMLVVFFIGVFSLSAFFVPERKVAAETIQASINGLHILEEGEYAVTTTQTGPLTGRMVHRALAIANGAFFEGDFDENVLPVITKYTPNAITSVPANDPKVLIRNLDDFAGYDESGKVEKAVEHKLKRSEKAQVIIRFAETGGRFYDKNDSPNDRSKKVDAFAKNKKAVVARLVGGTVVRDLPIVNGLAAEISLEDLQNLKNSPSVFQIELDRKVSAFLDTSPQEINAPYAWNLVDTAGNTLTGVGMRIAVIDTGVDYTHADLGGCLGTACKVIGGYDFVNNDADPMDDNGHGTHVSATAAGNGLLKGIAPDAKILAYKVLNNWGNGSFSQVIAGINRAIDPNNDGNPSDHADVLNMSLGAYCGTYSTGCGPDDLVSLAVDNATAAGVVSVVAAGNSGSNPVSVGSPGTARTAITVAAACKSSQIGTNSYCNQPIASFSSRGPVVWNSIDLQKPDISAPGVLICAARWATSFASSPTCFDTTHVRISGTSMATPHVAGVVALLKQANPNYTPDQIKTQLKNTARPLTAMTYNDEGAGEVDVEAAIPIVSQVTSLPSLWQPSTDPTKQISSSTQSFTITPKTALTTLSVSVSGSVAGITLSSDKSVLQMTGGTPDTFNVTVIADNDVAKAGRYNFGIELREGSVLKAVIPVFVTITPTITVVPSSVDYGVDDPSLFSWNSAQKQIMVTNTRIDATQNITISSTEPTGVTLNATPPTVTLPAGGSTSFTTSLSATNSSLANATYAGTLVFTNVSSSSVSIGTTFSKFYTLIIQDANTQDIVGSSIYLHNRATNALTYVSPTENPFKVYLTEPDSYDVKISYPKSGLPNTYIVLKENVLVSGITTLNTSRLNASHLVRVISTDIQGNNMTNVNSIVTIKNASISLVDGASVSGVYLSDVSPDFSVFLTARPSPVTTVSPLYLFGGVSQGVSGDVTFTNTPADLKKMVLQVDMNKPAGATTLPLLFDCDIDLTFCGGAWYVGESFVLPYSQIVYSARKSGWFYQISDYNATGCGSTACDTYFISPYTDMQNGVRRTMPVDIGSPFASSIVPGPMGSTTYNGLGPSVWSGMFTNAPWRIKLVPVFGIVGSPLLRQDYAKQDSLAIPYTILKDGVQVTSGSIPAWCMHCNIGSSANFLDYITNSSGNYEFRASFGYQNASENMLGSVVSTFNTTLADPNPPFITQLFYFTGGVRNDAYNPLMENMLQLKLDPAGGTLNAVGVAYSIDGTNFTPALVATTTNGYVVTVPSLPVSGKIALKISATDDAGNSLEYTFELPVHAIAPPDTTPPTVSITSPTDGATVSGTITIATTASDNVGVTKVEFFKDSDTTPFSTDTTSPYATSFDTKTLSNGSHIFKAKAWDAVGNNASTQVAVTVQNVIPDTTAPTVSLTYPKGGDRVTHSSNVTITATASDNIGVTKVEFRVNNVLKCTDTTSPYSCVWAVPASIDTKYSLTAKAYDAAGNNKTSATTTVRSK